MEAKCKHWSHSSHNDSAPTTAEPDDARSHDASGEVPQASHPHFARVVPSAWFSHVTITPASTLSSSPAPITGRSSVAFTDSATDSAASDTHSCGSRTAAAGVELAMYCNAWGSTLSADLPTLANAAAQPGFTAELNSDRSSVSNAAATSGVCTVWAESKGMVEVVVTGRPSTRPRTCAPNARHST